MLQLGGDNLVGDDYSEGVEICKILSPVPKEGSAHYYTQYIYIFHSNLIPLKPIPSAAAVSYPPKIHLKSLILKFLAMAKDFSFLKSKKEKKPLEIRSNLKIHARGLQSNIVFTESPYLYLSSTFFSNSI